MDSAALLARQSLVELGARARVAQLLDANSMRELLDPFERVISPWLGLQDIVIQADDGVILARGTLDGSDVVMAAIEPAFQGGSMGEVGGAKIAGALELALESAQAGTPIVPILLLETGGVRLQEANCGLAAIAEIHAAIVALREQVPVISVIAGPVGCFGGLSIAAGLCSHLVVTREARLGLNGPQVIEQEAGVDEFDSRDRPMIWSLLGGEQRQATGLADVLCEDDVDAVRDCVAAAIRTGPTRLDRTQAIDAAEKRLAVIDPNARADAADVRAALGDQSAGHRKPST